MRSISTAERPVPNVAALRDLAMSGDTDAIMALRQAGRHIGQAITGLVVGLAPALISVGGDVAQIGDHVIVGIRESLAQRTPPAISAQLRISATRDHNLTGVKGASALAFDLLFPA
ncbi:MAG: ROK family protein [Devosia sp.]